MGLNALIDSRDVKFVLYEILEADKLGKYEKFSAFDKDTYDATLELAEQIAVEQLYPASAEADKTGAKYDPQTKSVTIPEGYKTTMNLYRESGFPGLGNDPQWGGVGMPEVICRAIMDYFSAAAVGFITYDSLRGGASRLIENFGSDELKKTYWKK